MCLHLKSEKTRIQTAKKDIVVYKALTLSRRTIISRLSEVKHGDSFTGIIRGFECKGKISIGKDGRIFFCTNDSRLGGYSTINKLGYKYSWGFGSDLHKIIVNGEIMCDTEIIGHQTFYQDFKVEIGETYTSDLEKIDSTIEKGLHSFKTMKGAKSHSNIVAKCIIPKGSKYYIGEFTCETSYASDRLTYIEIIK